MTIVDSYRQNAADCLRQAEAEEAPEGKNLLLNVALAWVRLAHQVQEIGIPSQADDTHDADPAAPLAADTAEPPLAANDDAAPPFDKPLLTH